MDPDINNFSITIIAGNYPSEGRMNLVFVQQLVHELINVGIKVTVVAPQSITHAIVHRESLLPLFSRGKTGKGIEYEIYRPLSISFGNIKLFKKFSFYYNRRVIVKTISKINSDILYSHFWSSALPIYEYAKKNNIPLFVACGEGDNAMEDMVVSMAKDKLRQFASSVWGVVSVSSENKRKCIEYGLATEDNIEVFPNCVNTKIFCKTDVPDLKIELGIKEDDFVICFVGGFIPRKGPDRLAKAIDKLNDPQIKVLFIGKPFSGYSYDFSCHGIVYKGTVEHNLLPQYLNCADIFVLPTQKEGCSNAIVEALAVGLPVISSDGAFNDDILDDNNSIRVNPNDVDAIAEAISKFKGNYKLRKDFFEYSTSRHDEYSIERRAEKIVKFIKLNIIKRNENFCYNSNL
jgi:glycosyltransferase involved in cell wall biosynthesis